MTTSTRLMTADELLHMPDDGSVRHELIEGELIELPPPGFLHGVVVSNVSAVLRDFARARALGVVTTEAGFLISTDPDTVHAPDVSFVSADRLPTGYRPSGYLPFAPDLAVEVVSPTDRPRAVREKAQAWLAAGSRLVWLVYPSTMAVTVHRPGGEPFELVSGQTLDAAPVLEGLRIPVSSLFE